MEKADSYIIGRNAVMEALRSGQQIEKIFFCFGTQRTDYQQNILVIQKAQNPLYKSR